MQWNNINPESLIVPIFVCDGQGRVEEIKSMPNVYRYSLDQLKLELDEIYGLGLKYVLLFGVPDMKDPLGQGAYSELSSVVKAIRVIKENYPDLIVMTDVCMCAYTDHGHCGILDDKNEIDQGKTLEALAKIAIVHAKAGADWVAPSAMCRGQVLAIRNALDKQAYNQVKIMSYSAKFASSFYGPFRDAADSAPSFGDRSAYQLAYDSVEEALLCVENDIEAGADIVMVKPAMSYLDIIAKVKENFDKPLAVYNVSGEYSTVKLAAGNGLCEEKAMLNEIISSFKRAGADLIISYHSKDIARWINEE